MSMRDHLNVRRRKKIRVGSERLLKDIVGTIRAMFR